MTVFGIKSVWRPDYPVSTWKSLQGMSLNVTDAVTPPVEATYRAA